MNLSHNKRWCHKSTQTSRTELSPLQTPWWRCSCFRLALQMESRILETHLGSLIPTNVTPRTPHRQTRAQRKLLKLYGLALHSSASEAGGGRSGSAAMIQSAQGLCRSTSEWEGRVKCHANAFHVNREGIMTVVVGAIKPRGKFCCSLKLFFSPVNQ